MPRGDRTGPLGMGPMTGRGAGYCAGFATPGYANPVGGRWFGRGGMGGGRGYRHMYYATGLPRWARGGFWGGYGARPGWGMSGPMVPWGMAPQAPEWTPEQETGALKQQAEMLSEQLAEINKRLAELEDKE